MDEDDGLSGSILTWIGQLRGLEKLDIIFYSKPLFTVSLPTEVGKLTSIMLKWLQVVFNGQPGGGGVPCHPSCCLTAYFGSCYRLFPTRGFTAKLSFKLGRLLSLQGLVLDLNRLTGGTRPLLKWQGMFRLKVLLLCQRPTIP
jgi:hypothetical protein